jgi:hypothetical protein
MATRDEVQTLEAEIMAVEPDDQEIEGTAPADGAVPATPEDAPDATAESESIATEGPDAQAIADPVAPPAWQPPEGGQPFAFRVDGKEVAVEGALKYEHGTYIPAKAWDTVQQHLADRSAFAQRERQYQQHIRELDPEQHPRVRTADAWMQWLDGMLDPNKSPEEIAGWLDNLRVNKPLLDAQLRAQILEQQLNQRTQQHTERCRRTSRAGSTTRLARAPT